MMERKLIRLLCSFGVAHGGDYGRRTNGELGLGAAADTRMGASPRLAHDLG